MAAVQLKESTYAVVEAAGAEVLEPADAEAVEAADEAEPLRQPSEPAWTVRPDE